MKKTILGARLVSQMKQLYILLWLLIAVPLQRAGATTIWQGDVSFSWNEGASVSIDTEAFSDLQVGDTLRFSIIFTGQADYPQISLRNGNRKDLAAAPETALSNGMTMVDYIVNRLMLDDIQSGGLIIMGKGFSLIAVDILENHGKIDYRRATWIGSVVFPSDWSVIQHLPAACFDGAAQETVVRLHHKDLHPGAEALLRTANWNEVPGMDAYAQLRGNFTDIEVTTEMAEELTANGCFVDGIGFTLTAVEILREDELSQLYKSVPVVNDWMWFSPDVPMFRVNVYNPTDDPVDFDIVVRIADDRMTFFHDYTYTESLAGDERKEFEYTPEEAWQPGFYHATVLVEGEVAHSFYFGYDAMDMATECDMQDDFQDFWDAAKAELASVEAQYTLTEVPEKSSSQRKVYLLEMKSVADGTGEGIVRAYYAEPTASGTYPAVLHFCAYDGGGGLSIPDGDDHPSQIDIVVSTRGQSINNRPPYTNVYGDWLTYGFGDKDTWYYRGAYMDCLRALDFLFTREKVQTQNIFAEGASQGGAFSIALAALSDGKINAIAPAVPFLGDFPYYLQLVPWIANVLKGQQQSLGMSDEEMFTMLSYFDTKNLATLITCPVLMNFSLQDATCPPHINWAAYNHLGSAEKSFLTNPTLGHTVSATWGTDYSQFFASHLRSDADGIQSVPLARQIDDAVYDMHGVRHQGGLSDLPRGIYIQNGRKIVK